MALKKEKKCSSVIIAEGSAPSPGCSRTCTIWEPIATAEAVQALQSPSSSRTTSGNRALAIGLTTLVPQQYSTHNPSPANSSNIWEPNQPRSIHHPSLHYPSTPTPFPATMAQISRYSLSLLMMPVTAATLVVTVTLVVARPQQPQRHKQSKRRHLWYHCQKWWRVKMLALKYSQPTWLWESKNMLEHHLLKNNKRGFYILKC